MFDKGADNASKEASEKQYYVTDPDGKDDNPFRYCGEYYDKETEEVYLRVRYYQPEMGRFLTRDTYTGEEDEPESLHLYAYCENDGVNMTDPTGQWGEEKLSLKRLFEFFRYPYPFTHQNITYSAFKELKNKMKYQKYLKIIIEGSVLLDYYNKKKTVEVGKKSSKFHFINLSITKWIGTVKF